MTAILVRLFPKFLYLCQPLQLMQLKRLPYHIIRHVLTHKGEKTSPLQFAIIDFLVFPEQLVDTLGFSAKNQKT